MAGSRNSQKDADWYACPSCGAEVRVGSAGCTACRGQYSEAEEEGYLDGVDIPGENFDYNDFVEREFGTAGKAKPHGLRWYWWVTGIVLILAFIIDRLLLLF